MNRKALGKGLDALIPDFEMNVEGPVSKEGLVELKIEEVVPGPFQPRKEFDTERLEELADSIRENGVIQPIVVQTGEKNYEIICGERRWRAAQKAGLKTIPAVLREASSTERLQIALIENIHRQDLNPVEEAEAYQRLAHEFGLTQEAISVKVGKNRATVANYLRLLKLSREIKEDLISGKLSMGHARALLGIQAEKDRETLRKEIVAKGLNVRETEHRARQTSAHSEKKESASKGKKDVFVTRLEKELGRQLGTKVEIKPGKKGGKMTVSYYSNDDLARIRDMIMKV